MAQADGSGVTEQWLWRDTHVSSWNVGAVAEAPYRGSSQGWSHCLGALRWPCILQHEVTFPCGRTQGTHTAGRQGKKSWGSWSWIKQAVFSGKILRLEDRKVQSVVAFGRLPLGRAVREPLKLLKIFYILIWMVIAGGREGKRETLRLHLKKHTT